MANARSVSESRLTTGYLTALGVVALLTIASHLTLNRVLAAHEGSAAIINASGRQRMLSQRIAGLAAQYRLGSPTARDDMLEAINGFESAHHRLLADTSVAAPDDADSSALRAIYFGGDHPLDGEIADYVALARHIADTPPSAPGIDEALKRLFAEARAPLLSRLDEVVKRHQQDSEAQLHRLQGLQRITLGLVLATLATEALLIFRPMVRSIARYARELLRLATTDPLTGILNRHSFLERGQSEIARARRTGRPTSVLMLDADHFKRINDSFGHAGGDATLQALTRTMGSLIRSTDLLGRLGGEEFSILMPATSQEDAARLAERLREAIAALTLRHGGREIQITASIGVAGAAAGEADLTRLLREADQALYAAKEAGRNRVAAASAALDYA